MDRSDPLYLLAWIFPGDKQHALRQPNACAIGFGTDGWLNACLGQAASPGASGRCMSRVPALERIRPPPH